MKRLLMMIGAAVSVGAMLPLSAMADAVRVYDVDDYVQDGLVVHFDGIRNAGATAAHENSATTWTNLVDGQPNAEFVGDTGNWSTDGYYFKGTGSAYAMISSPGVALGAYATIQLALDATPSENTVKYTGLFRSLGDISDNLTFWSGNGDNVATITLKDDAYSGGRDRITLAGWEGKYVTAILGHENKYLFQGTIPENSKTRTAITVVPQTTYSFGGSDEDNRWFKGTYHSLRIYTNELSGVQLVQNRVVDEARYRNAASKGKGNDDVNVIVASNVEGVEGTEESGKWYIAEGTHTFTAPATKVVGAKFYTLSGYTVETWDGSAWGAAVTNRGASYAASSSAKVRLTWLWTLTLRGAAAYDVGDYVQDGLVAHFDGIRNAGATEAHNSTATTWKNLVDGGADAAFNSDGPVWTNSAGCYFNNNGAAYITEELDLGTNFTIQLATDIDLDSQHVGSTSGGWNQYRNYFNAQSGDVNGLWTKNGSDASKNLVGNFNNYAASGTVRPTINPWGGKYVTKMLSQNGMAYCFEDDSLPSGTDIAITKLPAAQTYSWGGLTNETSKGHLVCGTYHSVRLYTNTLDNAQLAQNRRVDEIRFRGKGDVTVVNGAIGDTGMNGASSLPDGAYNIESGTWTVTAANVPVDGDGVYMPRLLVETWDEATGEWVADTTRPVWTESYTIDKAALGDSRIRLTWTWGKRIGLTISFY